MPFHAHPSGRSGYPESTPRPEFPSPTGIVRLMVLMAAIAGPAAVVMSGAASPAGPAVGSGIRRPIHDTDPQRSMRR